MTAFAALFVILTTTASASLLESLFSYDMLGSLQEKMDVEQLVVADIDNSGIGEIIVVTTGKGGTQYTELKNTVYVFNSNGSLRWRYGTGREILASVVKDVNNDLNLETVLSSGVEKENIARGMIKILNKDGSAVREFSRTSLVGAMVIDDMNGDKYNEILTGSEGRVSLVYIDGEKIWDYPSEGNGTLPYGVYSVSTINLEDDNVLEVLFGSDAVYLLEKNGKFISSCEVDTSLDPLKRRVTYVASARLLKTVSPQVITATDANSVYGIDINNLNSQYINDFLHHRGNLKELWTYSFYNKINALKLYDTDKDGLDEILMANEDGNFYVLDNTGSMLWSFRVEGAAKDFLITDVEDDGNADILVASSSGFIYALDTTGDFEWKHDTLLPLGKIAAGDIDGDALPEIAVTTNKPEIYAFKLNQSFILKFQADNLYAQGERYFLSSSYTEAKDALVKARGLYAKIGLELDVNRAQSLISRIDAQVSEERRKLADVYYEKAQDYYISGNYDKSKSYVKMAKDIYGEFGDLDNVVKCELLEMRIKSVSVQTTVPFITTVPANESGFNAGGVKLEMLAFYGLLLIVAFVIAIIVLKRRKDASSKEKKEEVLDEKKFFSEINRELGGLNEK